MMTMKDWDKERISQYFDTADLWNLVNDSTQTEEAKPQIQNIILPETKLQWKRKVERTRRILPILRKRIKQ
ncbi:MAG: hypothetical protein ACW98W_20295 [Candidatus Hodarchaeales archaeon]|jgi:hypothetical protein